MKKFVHNELCKYDSVKPLPHDRAYFPRKGIIQNHIHAAFIAGQYSNLDQENLQHKIEEWKESTSDTFFLRKCGEIADPLQDLGHRSTLPKAVALSKAFPSDEDSDTEENQQGSLSETEESNVHDTFLFVHQSEKQKKLLRRYGHMVLLDATYRTTKYSLPVFLVVVPTNTMYVPVMEFICENETRACITEAISVLKAWNPDWNPNFFMLDYSDEEYQALHEVFPEAKKYLCTFHREQAWHRWAGKD